MRPYMQDAMSCVRLPPFRGGWRGFFMGKKKGTRPFPSCLLQYHTASKAFYHLVIHVNLFLFLKTKPVVLK